MSDPVEIALRSAQSWKTVAEAAEAERDALKAKLALVDSLNGEIERQRVLLNRFREALKPYVCAIDRARWEGDYGKPMVVSDYHQREAFVLLAKYGDEE